MDSPATRPISTVGMHTEAGEPLGSELCDRVLDRLGLTVLPPLTADGLNALYSAWGRAVPFDNLQKRISLAAGHAAPLPCATAEAFFAGYLDLGTGATCWPSSNAFHALLRACGFDASRLTGTMVPGARHGSVLVEIGGDALLVDTWMASGIALPLTQERAAAGLGASQVRAEPHGRLWRVWWLHPTRDEERHFRMEERDVTFSRAVACYEMSRTDSPFNTRLFARKNVAGGVVCIANGARHFRDATRITARELAPKEITQVLIEEFGYSEAIVALLPPDQETSP